MLPLNHSGGGWGPPHPKSFGKRDNPLLNNLEKGKPHYLPLYINNEYSLLDSNEDRHEVKQCKYVNGK